MKLPRYHIFLFSFSFVVKHLAETCLKRTKHAGRAEELAFSENQRHRDGLIEKYCKARRDIPSLRNGQTSKAKRR